MSQTNTSAEATWQTYTQSWGVKTREEKLRLFKQSLSETCVYNDPSAITHGQTALADHMLGFHDQVPGGHFVTKHFLTHSNKSIARWDMKNASGETIGEGISYGEYGDDGKLISMTGFF